MSARKGCTKGFGLMVKSCLAVDKTLNAYKDWRDTGYCMCDSKLLPGENINRPHTVGVKKQDTVQ